MHSMMHAAYLQHLSLQCGFYFLTTRGNLYTLHSRNLTTPCGKDSIWAYIRDREWEIDHIIKRKKKKRSAETAAGTNAILRVFLSIRLKKETCIRADP